MALYLDLDDAEDIVIHLHDIARLVERQVDSEAGLKVKQVAEKLLKEIREQSNVC